MVEKGFQLSEASNTPIFYMMRIRGCHVTGEFVARDNVPPSYSNRSPVTPTREPEKIILPPFVYQHEQEKIARRLPAAVEFIKEQKLNELFPGQYESLGIITCGGSYNTVIRALQRQGLADVYGNADIPIYCLNVAYPLVPDELVDFCVGKEQVLVLEEGQPEYIEQGIQTVLRRRDADRVRQGHHAHGRRVRDSDAGGHHPLCPGLQSGRCAPALDLSAVQSADSP